MSHITLQEFDTLKVSKEDKLSLVAGQVKTLVIRQANNLPYAERFDGMDIIACDHTPGVEVAHLEKASEMLTFPFLDLTEYGTVWFCL
jgi:hypothetical protein